LVDIGICEALVFARDCRSPWRVSRPLLEELMNARSGRIRDPGLIPLDEHLALLGFSCNRQLADAPLRVRGNGLEQSPEVTEHALNALAHEPRTHGQQNDA